MNPSEFSHLLGRFSPFEDLSTDYLAQVAEYSQLISIEKGKIIFRRGKKLEFRYYLVQGSVDLIGASFKASNIQASDSEARFPLTESSPTNVSAVAKEDCQLIQVEADFLDIAMAWSQSTDDIIETMINEDVSQQIENELPETVNLTTAHIQVDEADNGKDWMSSLLQSSQFMRIPSANIQKLFQCFQPYPVKAGDIILKEGDQGDYFYILERGKASVTKLVSNIDITLSAGSHFGEEALVTDAPRNASITMLTDGLLMRINKQDFTTLMQQPAQRHLSFEDINSAEHASSQLVDVRMPVEFRHQHVEGAINIPMSRLRKKIPDLSQDTLYVVTDDGGRRSELATYLLCQLGLNACLLKGSAAHYTDNDG